VQVFFLKVLKYFFDDIIQLKFCHETVPVFVNCPNFEKDIFQAVFAAKFREKLQFSDRLKVFLSSMKYAGVPACIYSVLFFVGLVHVDLTVHLLCQLYILHVKDLVYVHALPITLRTPWTREQKVCSFFLRQINLKLLADSYEVT